MAAIIVKIAWPRLEPVSICSRSEMNSTSGWRKSSSVSTKCRTEPSKAVEGSDHHHIDSPSLHFGHQLVHSGALLTGARDALIHVLGDTSELTSAAVFPKIVKLILAGLVARRDASIDRGTLHSSPPSSGAFTSRGTE